MTTPFNPQYGQPTNPPPKPKSKLPLGLILVCIFGGLFLVGALLASTSSKTVTVTAPPATSPPSTEPAVVPASSPTTETPTTKAPTTTTPPTTKAPTTTTTKLSDAVRDWVHERDVVAALTPISDALGSISSSSTPSSMKRACQQIQAALPAYAATLPSPDPELTDEMQTSHDHLQRAAKLCIDGITYSDAADLEQAADEFGLSTAATKRANVILQHHVDS